ncbi:MULTISPECIES: GntR family transcriptional regulator [Corynebacterium]|uniref:HTH-type transcriptional regulator n=1 Tax=Corynebacterium minutissimum TaxID=38301 RepID=A0A376D2B4_9CORY|nr:MULTISPECIES: GntR family transcriptional regulator [Corynebacterium]MCG7228795.1 GntR family transcriptional regulator [Corynebacterium minutissimum]MCG7237912.1 GntR family transcriptional regulator [Corynebacterium minutissimum]OFR64776.1 transcriptional regulator [Corynebacterium sp. HMSC078H07]QRP61606.1 GntR family transcriptional regulator [Corynebacterium minutissimum]QRP98222.1 GntR family transcriptional regulator [Corynebacterium sp. FDAARGOS 1242]
MSTSQRRRPAYLVIADSLRSKIESGELQPGDRFPTERELVQEYKVARMTVRHALDIVQIEGLIDRKRGRTGGTFVRATPPTLSLTSGRSALQQLREHGLDISVQVLSLVLIDAPGHLASALGIEDEDPVWEARAVHVSEGSPIMATTLLIPHSLAPELKEQDLEKPLSTLLAELGLPPVFKRDSLMAATARTEEQKILGVGRTQPVLRITRTVKMEDGTVVAQLEETLRPDAVSVEVELGEDPSPSLD